MIKTGDKVTEKDLSLAEHRVELALAALKRVRKNLKDAEETLKEAQAMTIEIQAAIKYNQGVIK